MYSNFKYHVNEKAQIFVKLDNDSIAIDYKRCLSDIQDVGINSIQIIAGSISNLEIINKIDLLSNIGFNNVILNLSNIKGNLIDMLPNKLSCISIWLTGDSLDDKLELNNRLKMINNNVGINLRITNSDDWVNLINIIIEKYRPTYIIIDPNYQYNGMPNLSMYSHKLEKYQDQINKFSVPIYMSVGIYNKFFLMDHPCNIYLCSGINCHTGKGNKVRRLYIDEKGNVLPESFDFNKIYTMGNINDEPLKNIIVNSDIRGYDDKFLSLCKTLHENVVIPSPSFVIPWVKLLTFWSNNYYT